MIKILLCSDNKNNQVHLIEELLKDAGFNITICSFADCPDLQLKETALVLLDLSERNALDGDFTERAKTFLPALHKNEIPSLFILHPDNFNRFLDLDLSGDDFILTSSLSEEALPRIKFLLRKNKIIIPKNSIVVDEMILNLDKYELRIDGEVIELTFKEFELLKILLENPNKVLTRASLLSIVWEYDFYGGSRTVDVHMRRLRSKITPPYNLMLKTIRNVGYMFAPQK